MLIDRILTIWKATNPLMRLLLVPGLPTAGSSKTKNRPQNSIVKFFTAVEVASFLY
jgi:hypothetical protein